MIGEMGHEISGDLLDRVVYCSGLGDSFTDLPATLVPVIEEALVGGDEAARAELSGPLQETNLFEDRLVLCAAERCGEILAELSAQRQREINTVIGRGC